MPKLSLQEVGSRDHSFLPMSPLCASISMTLLSAVLFIFNSEFMLIFFLSIISISLAVSYFFTNISYTMAHFDILPVSRNVCRLEVKSFSFFPRCLWKMLPHIKRDFQKKNLIKILRKKTHGFNPLIYEFHKTGVTCISNLLKKRIRFSEVFLRAL